MSLLFTIVSVGRGEGVFLPGGRGGVEAVVRDINNRPHTHGIAPVQQDVALMALGKMGGDVGNAVYLIVQNHAMTANLRSTEAPTTGLAPLEARRMQEKLPKPRKPVKTRVYRV